MSMMEKKWYQEALRRRVLAHPRQSSYQVAEMQAELSCGGWIGEIRHLKDVYH